MFIEDRPLIAQFAAKNGIELANAAELVYKWVNLKCHFPSVCEHSIVI